MNNLLIERDLITVFILLSKRKKISDYSFCPFRPCAIFLSLLVCKEER